MINKPNKVMFESKRVGKDKCLIHLAFNGYMNKNILYVKSPTGAVVECYAKTSHKFPDDVNMVFDKCVKYFSSKEFGAGVQHFMQPMEISTLAFLYSISYNKKAIMPESYLYDGHLF